MLLHSLLLHDTFLFVTSLHYSTITKDLLTVWHDQNFKNVMLTINLCSWPELSLEIYCVFPKLFFPSCLYIELVWHTFILLWVLAGHSVCDPQQTPNYLIFLIYFILHSFCFSGLSTLKPKWMQTSKKITEQNHKNEYHLIKCFIKNQWFQ